ncbi:Tat (twin-arginine translocation) pathway signal sequence [Catalinimonas alkaloidigena]|uniref:Tat (Twin-arginine translocation) pathway signal sequence n=1 Tax=Catalinimonas alkaloidigena TaxID=1075417 RepID=A0A1G9GDW1_9BACT|nr:sugar phosphate isomerase/epimerase family protein [Catalinimonas alkaloidigena]SDK98792.1 Tat (twin-arginine translocation) pathway signal sequence [Catalinimonas alkaloidigena]
MHLSRRSFLKTSALAAAGATLLPPKLLAARKPKELVGVQLYSIRDAMKADPLATLTKLADMGYQHVEHANYIDRKFYGYAPKEFKKVLDDLGLKMPSGHTVMRGEHWDAAKKDFTDAWKYTVEDAAVLGQEYVISPWLDESLRKSYDGLLQFMEVFNKSGELCKKSGMKFGYHNHDFEFSESLNGQTLYDLILTHTDPKLVIQQLDIGNMIGGGGDPQAILSKYPDRFPSMHVKDEIASQEEHSGYESTILGKGIVGTKEIAAMGKKMGGTKHFIIEQESYQGMDPLDSVKEDLMIMKKWGYVS